MKYKELRKTGIDILGNAPWGTHFCQFYETKEDLLSILVPYFKAGLENNEFCMWVTSQALTKNDALEAMRKAVPDFNRFLNTGQIEIIPYDNWYLGDGVFELKRVLTAWIDRLNSALAKGYDGLRVTGNTAWLETKDWRNFVDYEEELNSVIGSYRIIAICSYSLDKCNASEILDVMVNHQFALIRRDGIWEIIESTEYKRAREALIESEERYRDLVENINDTIYSCDRNGLLTYISPVIETIAGYKPSEIVGKYFTEFIVPDDLPRIAKQFEEVLLGRIEPSEYRVKNRKGEVRWVRTSSRPVYKNDQVVGLTGILTDITKRKQAEEALLATMKELKIERQRIEELVQKVIETQEKERHNLAVSVHDELLQGLVAVLYFLQMIDTQTLNSETSKRKETLMEIIKSSIDRGRKLIQEMEPINQLNLNIYQTIKRFISLNFADTKVKIRFSCPKSLARIDMSLKTNFLRIIQEALINVRTHANATKVSVIIKADKNRLVMEVRDNGCGFTPKPNTSSVRGHFGLLTMKQRAIIVGGKLTVISQPDKGTIVKGVFPFRSRGKTNEEDKNARR